MLPVPIICARCEISFPEMNFILCPICHKQVCARCWFAKGGKYFCSRYCAEYFFYADEDDEG